jgi:hypothetical protein
MTRVLEGMNETGTIIGIGFDHFYTTVSQWLSL